MRKLKIFSFFSGSGFLDLGFETNGFEIELVNEYSPAFQAAYKYAREKMNLRKPTYGYSSDVNEYLTSRAEELQGMLAEARKDSSLVGFIGGPPCPDFSVAGKQRGRDGDNGKLSLSYVKLIINQQPDFFLFENVKGLWSTAKHRAYYNELKEMLAAAGYYMTDRLTNALEYGAPQDRDRVLLFGIKKGVKAIEEDPTQNFPWGKYQKYTMEQIKSIHWPATEKFEKDSKTECPAGVPIELTTQYWFDKNEVDSHPNAADHFVPRAGLARMKTIEEGDDSKKSYKRIHRWRYSPTACYGNNEVHLHPYKERRLSVAETLAIQTLPKEFSLPADMTLTDKFKTIGNGVPYILSSGIAKTIYEFLQEGEQNGKDNCDIPNERD